MQKVTVRVFEENEKNCEGIGTSCEGMCIWRNGHWICGKDLEEQLKR